MTVMTVHPPRLQDALDIAFVAGTADVIDDLVATAFLQGLANPSRDQRDRFLPTNFLPLSLTTPPHAPHRIEDSIRIIDLVDRCGAFRAQPAPTRGMYWIAFELPDCVRFLIDVGQKATSRFTIEASRGYKP